MANQDRENLKLAMTERRMLADRIANAVRYDGALNRLELPPNGDDYNAIMGMLSGAAYIAPHVKGR